MTWNVGDRLELTLQGFAHDGRTVAHPKNSPVVFAQGGLPGQRVLVELTAVKKRMAEGEVREILTPVPDDLGGERPAPCSHAADCGGCPWQCLPYAVQLRWKHQLVVDALTRIGKLVLPDGLVQPVLASPATMRSTGEWGYRNKMEFAFAPGWSSSDGAGSKDGIVLGLRRRASHDIVEVTGCLLQTPRTMRILAEVRELANKSGLPAWNGAAGEMSGALRYAVIREPATDAETCLMELITAPTNADTARTVQTLGRALLTNTPEVTGFVHSIRAATSDVAYGEKTAFTLGNTSLRETLHLTGHDVPVAFDLGHTAFFQVNTAATELLYNTAAGLNQASSSSDNALEENYWDVYCGVGGLTLALAPRFRKVFGLESVSAAVALARKNATNFPQCRFETTDAARLGEYFRRYGTPALLSTDPPRAGLDPEVVQAILRARPRRLLLVSCNPATLARDLALLTTAYTLNSIQPVDLFPQTPHVETVVSLTARDENNFTLKQL